MIDIENIQKLWKEYSAALSNLTAFSHHRARSAPADPISFSTQEEVDKYNMERAKHLKFKQNMQDNLSALQKITKDSKIRLLHALPANTWISVGIGSWISKQTNDWPGDDGDLLHATNTSKSELKEIRHRIIN
jgi:hypothetical protein